MDDHDRHWHEAPKRRSIALPIAFALLGLTAAGYFLWPSIAAILADPLAGNPY